jgi:5-methylcytosine-specific restriction endonuclease McrA
MNKKINNVEHKWCWKCEKYLPLGYFNRSCYTSDRLTRTCKNCLSKGNKRGRPAGYIMSEESKQTISKKLSARTLPEIHKNKIGKSMLGNKNRGDIGGDFNYLEPTKRPASYETYALQLSWCEEVRQSPENLKILEVKCAYCGCWFIPTRTEVFSRVSAINGRTAGECRFYCSENCKTACPIYNKTSWPEGFKKATSREVVPLLRQLVLERDNYTCQKCGATTETAQLHVHHVLSYMLNKMVANDPDNCITLCKACHKEVHSQDGCKYSDLKCK